MDILNKLKAWVERKPIVLVRLPDGFYEGLGESKRGLDRFTIARPHTMFRDLNLPTICLVAMGDGQAQRSFVGCASSKAAVATFDSRLTLKKLKPLDLPSIAALRNELGAKIFKNAYQFKLNSGLVAVGMTPKLSVAILNALSVKSANRSALEFVARQIPKLSPPKVAEWEQLDAIKTAMAAFGLSKSECPWIVETTDDSDSTLTSLDRYQAHVFEDYAIQKDAGTFPDYALIQRDLTGRAVFVKGNQRLEIFTANRGPLEAMLGVDLVYINETVGSTIMVQYKMLERLRDAETKVVDWVYRPDAQLEREMARMRLPSFAGSIDDYRLHRDPFFFKFVRRKGDGESHHSFIISRDHLKQLLDDPIHTGPRGGVRISFDALGGAYLRDSDLGGLIKSGYVGTHRNESEALHALISEVARGNRALVLAWQRQIEWEEGDGEPDLVDTVSDDRPFDDRLPF
jgi:hypothetical protein